MMKQPSKLQKANQPSIKSSLSLALAKHQATTTTTTPKVVKAAAKICATFCGYFESQLVPLHHREPEAKKKHLLYQLEPSLEVTYTGQLTAMDWQQMAH